jgi:hypothetical protein
MLRYDTGETGNSIMSTLLLSRQSAVWRSALALLGVLSLVGGLLIVSAGPLQAADGVLYANRPAIGVFQLTLPNPIWLPGSQGGHIWVSDNLLGFCRVDGPPDGTSGALSVNSSTCVALNPKAPGEAIYDPRPNLDGTHYVYLSDNAAAKSVGVVRVAFDPGSETIKATSPVTLGDGATAGQTNSIALNPADGKLYVAHRRSGSIMRITNPNLDVSQQSTEIVGRTSDGRGVRGGLTFVCGAKASTCDLYIGEFGGNGVTVIPDARGCNPFGFGGCAAMPTSITTNNPGGLTSDGTQFIFVGDSPLTNSGTILRYNVDTDVQDVISSHVPAHPVIFPVAQTQTTYAGIAGIAVSPNGDLYVGDDPTLNQIAPPPQQGKLWKIAGVYNSNVQCDAQATPPVTTACADALGSPNNPAQIVPPPSLAQPASVLSFGQTSPHGMVWIPGALGGHMWVADHTQGLCRLDPAPDHDSATDMQFATNPSVCDLNGTIGSPGQPVYDPVGNFVYVPDQAVKSPGLWRMNFDPTSETISAPTLMAPGAGLDNDKLDGVAMGPDNNLYAGGLKNGFIYRIQNPRGDPTAMQVDIIGTTTDNRGINGTIGFLGNDLYLPENKGAGVITNATHCATPSSPAPCTSTLLSIPSVIFASSIATDQINGVVYVAVASGAANGTIYRYTPATRSAVTYATQAQLPHDLLNNPSYIEDCTKTCERPQDPGVPRNGVIGFHFPLGMFVDASGTLFIGDDPTAGVRGFHGHVFSVAHVQ